HQRDNSKLIGTLERLRDLGNTVIVVEHDEQTMRAADHLVDLGPGAGEHGGWIVAEGTADDVQRVEASLTGQFLSGARTIHAPAPIARCAGWRSWTRSSLWTSRRSGARRARTPPRTRACST